jgi:hypothetical protein
MRNHDENVQRGAALLDEKVPGWDKLIDLDTLRMSSCTSCIVGQVMLTTHADEIGKYYSDSRVYARGLTILGVLEDEGDYDEGDQAIGFNLYPEEDDDGEEVGPDDPDWAALGEAWKKLILARRTA